MKRHVNLNIDVNSCVYPPVGSNRLSDFIYNINFNSITCISGCKRIKINDNKFRPNPYSLLKIWFVHQIYLWLCCSLIHRFIATTLFHISNPHVIGLTKKLDYVQGIGADVLVLSSIYEQSPQGQDLGQEIVNFTNVDKKLGTLKDFEDLMTSAEEKGRMKCCLRLYFFLWLSLKFQQ